MILKADEPFKLEVLDSIQSEPITIYSMVSRKTNATRASTGEESEKEELAVTSAAAVWWDLCAGPHLESTGQVNAKAVELLTIAGAYWRGDEKQPMLQVIIADVILVYMH